MLSILIEWIKHSPFLCQVVWFLHFSWLYFSLVVVIINCLFFLVLKNDFSYVFLIFGFGIRIMLQLQTILQHFYKLLMWLTFYWFSFRVTINIIFSLTNNHSPHQHFVKNFVKKFVSLVLLLELCTRSSRIVAKFIAP